jgi:hypothetical protein
VCREGRSRPSSSRHELEEDVVVRDQAQQAVARVLGGDEPLGGGVGFEEAHGLAADAAAEQAAVRLEAGAAVDDQAQARPDVGDARTSRHPFEVVEQHQQPGGDAAERGDRQGGGALGEQPHLRLPVAQQGQLQRREGVRPQHRRHLAGRDAAQVAGQHGVRRGIPQLLQVGAAAQEEEPAGEQRRAGRVGQEKREGGEGGLAVGRQHLRRDGDVLGRAAGRARREGEVRDAAGPGDVAQAGERLPPVPGPERLVVAQRDAPLVVGRRADVVEIVLAPEARVPGVADQAQQRPPLRPLGRRPVEAGDAVAGVAPQGRVGEPPHQRLSRQAFHEGERCHFVVGVRIPAAAGPGAAGSRGAGW